MKLLLLTTTAIVLSGCVSSELIICNEDIVYDGKLDTPVETCREDNPSVIAKVWNIIKHGDDDDPTTEMSIPDDTDDSTDDTGDPDEGNEHPDEPDEGTNDNDKGDDDDSTDDSGDTNDSDKPERVKGNNGFGNGDQSAPGKSLDNNNAENSGRGNKD